MLTRKWLCISLTSATLVYASDHNEMSSVGPQRGSVFSRTSSFVLDMPLNTWQSRLQDLVATCVDFSNKQSDICAIHAMLSEPMIDYLKVQAAIEMSAKHYDGTLKSLLQEALSCFDKKSTQTAKALLRTKSTRSRASSPPPVWQRKLQDIVATCVDFSERQADMCAIHTMLAEPDVNYPKVKAAIETSVASRRGTLQALLREALFCFEMPTNP